MTCYTLHTQWTVFRTILLSGDVETNPGPETLEFSTWNFNSISVHDFLCVSLIEAYNSVYNYDLIGVVETHLDNTVDKDRLALDGYTSVLPLFQLAISLFFPSFSSEFLPETSVFPFYFLPHIIQKFNVKMGKMRRGLSNNQHG